MAEIRKWYLQSWLGLTVEAVHYDLPQSHTTKTVHLYKTSKNKISTQPTLDTSAEK